MDFKEPSLLTLYLLDFLPVQVIYTKVKQDPNSIHDKDQYENTLLHYAVKDSKSILVELLIKCGAKVNAMNIYNETPLLFGLNNGYVTLETLKLLVQSNININDSDKWGRNACFFSSRNIEFLRILCKHGANINCANENGYTALMRSSTTEDLEFIKIMVNELKANPNSTDDKGKSALVYAIDSNNSDDVVYFLLSKTVAPLTEAQKCALKRFFKSKQTVYEIF